MLRTWSSWRLAILLLSTLSSTALGDDVQGATVAINDTTPTAEEGEITVHYVNVSSRTHYFTPNSINALPGDIVNFRFWPGDHSVIRADYGYPCIPYEDLDGNEGEGFYSGVKSPNATDVEEGNLPTWNLTINSTSPLFFYCGAPGSCVRWGMIGAINADAEHSIETQIKVAREANYVLTPGEPLPADAMTSMEHLASSATTVTVTDSPTSSSTSDASAAEATSDESSGGSDDDSGSSGLSTGAIVGIAIGGAALLALAGGLFYFFGRSKTLSEQLRHSRNPSGAPGPPTHPDPYQNYGPAGANSRHTSGLPPYAQIVPPYASEAKPPGPLEADGGILPHGYGHGQSPMSSPEMRQSETFGGFSTYADSMGRDRQMRFSHGSEMAGSDVSRQASPQPQQQMQMQPVEMASDTSPRDGRGSFGQRF